MRAATIADVRRALSVQAYMRTVECVSSGDPGRRDSAQECCETVAPADRSGKPTDRAHARPGAMRTLALLALLAGVALTRRERSAIPNAYRPKRSLHVLPASRPRRAGCPAHRHSDRERAGSPARLD